VLSPAPGAGAEPQLGSSAAVAPPGRDGSRRLLKSLGCSGRPRTLFSRCGGVRPSSGLGIVTSWPEQILSSVTCGREGVRTYRFRLVPPSGGPSKPNASGALAERVVSAPKARPSIGGSGVFPRFAGRRRRRPDGVRRDAFGRPQALSTGGGCPTTGTTTG
jgi:hypothetical protein